MKISSIVILVHLKSTVGLQDDTQRNQVHNFVPPKNQNHDYYYQQSALPSEQFSQHYVPVPIQLLKSAMYSQQPQAALIIVKAFPVYLSPTQANNLQHGAANSLHHGDAQNLQNVQMIHYNPAPRIPAYTNAEPTEPRSVVISPQRHVTNSNYYTNGNPSILFAPSSNNVQGGSYLNNLAQIVAQQYSKNPYANKSPTTPAIVTGLENFSPEQQNQIKSHLKNYIDSHAGDTSTQNDVAEHREIMRTSDSIDEKYSSRISTPQYNQQSDWLPGQGISTNGKNFGDKS